MSSTTESASRYEKLLERADEFVAGHQGVVHEDLLIRHVFGNAGSPELWRPLIRQVLSQSDRLGLRGDGYWTLAGRASDAASEGSLFAADFTVIDVETTGLKPYQQRVIEFGAVRFRNGVQEGSLSLLIHPERAVPKYIRKLTGIDDEMLRDEPLFPEIAREILEFIGDDQIVGYNTSFDTSFINAELRRAELEPLVNAEIDLLPVASAMLPGSRARGLGSLARELGLTTNREHRALNDATTTAQVLFQLTPRLRAAGFSQLAELASFRRPQRATETRSEPAGRGRSLLDPEHVEHAPATPGVYIMRGAGERVLYVGKAKDLRARIRSYYSQPLGYTRKMDGLLQSIQRIETIETGSELAALLLEAQLISRYRPQFNRQMRSSDNYPYIRVDTSNPWPRVSLARQSADDGARYYGPYRSLRAAKATVEALNEIFPLRTCTRSFKTAKSYGSPCTALDLGHCLGPCTGRVNADTYHGYVREIIQFLEGDVEPVLDRLQQHLEATAMRLDFERATRVRNRISRVTDLAESQQVLTDAQQLGQLAIVLAAPHGEDREILLTRHGRPWSRHPFSQSDDVSDVACSLETSWQRAIRLASPIIPQHELDTVQIIARWVRKHWGHSSIIPIEDGAPDWNAVVGNAREIDLIP